MDDAQPLLALEKHPCDRVIVIRVDDLNTARLHPHVENGIFEKDGIALHPAPEIDAGCRTIFKDDGLSGATRKRPALLRCLKKLEHGDTLTVWKLDRLGRSLRDDHHARRHETPRREVSFVH